MRELEFFIPGYWPGPNQRDPTTRGRMSTTKRLRDKASLYAKSALNAARLDPFTGRARVKLECRRFKLLDPSVNLPASLKAYQDGICRACLPVRGGDSPTAPYEWYPFEQIRVPRGDEGVYVMIEEPEAGDEHIPPFSGLR